MTFEFQFKRRVCQKEILARGECFRQRETIHFTAYIPPKSNLVGASIVSYLCLYSWHPGRSMGFLSQIGVHILDPLLIDPEVQRPLSYSHLK